MPNPAAAAVNQSALSRLEVSEIEQGSPRCKGRHRGSRGAHVMERLRFNWDRGFANRDVIRITAVACRLCHCEDLIASFELRYTLANLFHHASHIPTGDQRMFLWGDFFC